MVGRRAIAAFPRGRENFIIDKKLAWRNLLAGLQVLPAAARLVLLFGAMPVTIGLLLSRDWYFTGMGLTFLLGAGVILRTIATTRSAVFESLRSRSEMATLIEALALDDFGTGYASLTHLQQFPVHVLKIDRSFISRLNSADSADFAIVHA